ncbi:hypothetical protein [Kitasatospora aureofaciens]|uniref:hypothetical protein n=1 Tax=Kitasatospora aureofaciens TaxID=1894 RepID=UPI0036F4816B
MSPTTFPVEFRPISGPIRQITVTSEQWRGEVCAVGRGCSGELRVVGDLCNKAEAPGSPRYLGGAYAHLDCLRPVELELPSLCLRRRPTVTPTW